MASRGPWTCKIKEAKARKHLNIQAMSPVEAIASAGLYIFIENPFSLILFGLFAITSAGELVVMPEGDWQSSQSPQTGDRLIFPLDSVRGIPS